jgi:large subunit ribosomal protein L22
MKAILRRIRISPKKANLVAGIVRGMKVTDALATLKFTPKKGAHILYKVIHSAASNAKNNYNQNWDDLYITKLLVTMGPTFKRTIPVSRGRAHPLLKRTSHITVEVGVLGGESGKPAADTAKKHKHEAVATTAETKTKKPATKEASKADAKAAKKEPKKESKKPEKAGEAKEKDVKKPKASKKAVSTKQ